MSDATQDEPVMDGAQDAGPAERAEGLAEQVRHDHEDRDEQADAMADRAADVREAQAEDGAGS